MEQYFSGPDGEPGGTPAVPPAVAPPGPVALCGATLRHAHGVALCWFRADHEGKHRGPCDLCEECGEDVTLSWTEHREEWPL